MYVYFGKPRTWWVSPIAIIEFVRWVLRYPQPDYFYDEPWFKKWDRRMRPWCESVRNFGNRWLPTPHIVRVDKWDLYSPNNTLSDVIVPVLKAFRDKTFTVPAIDQDDLPDFMRIVQNGEFQDYPEHAICFSDEDDIGLQQWHFILNEIIWSLEQKRDNFFDEPQEHRESLRERMMNGHRLFGKYYRHLWW